MIPGPFPKKPATKKVFPPSNPNLDYVYTGEDYEAVMSDAYKLPVAQLTEVQNNSGEFENYYISEPIKEKLITSDEYFFSKLMWKHLQTNKLEAKPQKLVFPINLGNTAKKKQQEILLTIQLKNSNQDSLNIFKGKNFNSLNSNNKQTFNPGRLYKDVDLTISSSTPLDDNSDLMNCLETAFGAQNITSAKPLSKSENGAGAIFCEQTNHFLRAGELLTKEKINTKKIRDKHFRACNNAFKLRQKKQRSKISNKWPLDLHDKLDSDGDKESKFLKSFQDSGWKKEAELKKDSNKESYYSFTNLDYPNEEIHVYNPTFRTKHSNSI